MIKVLIYFIIIGIVLFFITFKFSIRIRILISIFFPIISYILMIGIFLYFGDQPQPESITHDPSVFRFNGH